MWVAAIKMRYARSVKDMLHLHDFIFVPINEKKGMNLKVFLDFHIVQHIEQHAANPRWRSFDMHYSDSSNCHGTQHLSLLLPRSPVSGVFRVNMCR